MPMKKILALAAVSETATGLILLAYPQIMVRLLFGTETMGSGIIIGRFAGIMLVGLGIACWPSGKPEQAFYGMLTYSTLAPLFLAYAGVIGLVRIFLWPGVAVHAGLSLLLVRTWRKEQKAAGS